MKSSMLFLCLFMPFSLFGQLNESFSDGNFTENPVWTGMNGNFKVNDSFQLQSAAPGTSVSGLFTSSRAIEAASWECTFRIDYSTSSSNYAGMYLVADTTDLSLLSGYFVQIGGTADEVSLYRQQGAVKTKIIDGVDKRTDGKTVAVKVKVTRDSLGVFNLYSRLGSEAEFYHEGTVTDLVIHQSVWFGLFYSNTASTGYSYYFDDILVTGRKVTDPPLPLQPGEFCFNEILFHATDSAAEYLEFYNCSERKLVLSGCYIAVRRSDGSLTKAITVPDNLKVEAGSYHVFTSDNDRLAAYYTLPEEAMVTTCKWSNLNNEGGRLLFIDPNTAEVIDSVNYSSSQHHVLIVDPEGVSLEKMHPMLPSYNVANWHSAAGVVGYGTPGVQNSQYREYGIGTGELIELEQDWFSPDNDGMNDCCVIRYKMPAPGYMVRLAIYTSDGAKWLELNKGEILPTEGYFVWDGQNREGRISLPGIYVLVAELFHAELGVTKCLKMPVLLTIR